MACFEGLVAPIEPTNRGRGRRSEGALHGIAGYEPIRRDRRARLEALRTPAGRLLPPRAKAEIVRELERLEIVAAQLADVEKERDAAITSRDGGVALERLRAIGPEFASVLTLEAFFRNFSNRRQVAAYSGFAPAPWQSGGINRDQPASPTTYCPRTTPRGCRQISVPSARRRARSCLPARCSCGPRPLCNRTTQRMSRSAAGVDD
jgi:Transposase IS116/IS110/IS902 family